MGQPTPSRSGRRSIDLATVLGLAVAVGAILGGLLLEGGKITDIGQLTAAMIVLGGTLGAVMVTTPVETLKAAVKKLPQVVWNPASNYESLLDDILNLSAEARKNRLIAIDNQVQELPNPFLKKTLSMAIDGTDPKVIRGIMELEICADEKRGEAEAKVFESAGGYAPTIGIIGAVLGLIQVMKHLEDIEAVGHGIAVAFVATVYGVAVANLVFLPIANKLKSRVHHSVDEKEFLLEGAMAIVEGLHPNLIRHKLLAFASEIADSAGEPGERRAAARAASAVRSAA